MTAGTKRQDWELCSTMGNDTVPSTTKRKAVTVDMIATGTDVKPLECLIFMRNIKSWSYFEQMKGRDLASKRRTSRNEVLKQGPDSRVIDSGSLKSVTPDAACKTRFVIVDLLSQARHAIDPESPLRPVGQTVEERFTEWLAEQQLESDGDEFTEEQMQWLLAIKDHIASSLMIEQDEFEYAPFSHFGGIGRAYELFGRKEEVDNQLAA